MTQAARGAVSLGRTRVSSPSRRPARRPLEGVGAEVVGDDLVAAFERRSSCWRPSCPGRSCRSSCALLSVADCGGVSKRGGLVRRTTATARRRTWRRSHTLVLERLLDVVHVDRRRPAGRPAAASSGSASTVRATVPWSSKASSVPSGMVLTVAGPMRPSTYSRSSSRVLGRGRRPQRPLSGPLSQGLPASPLKVRWKAGRPPGPGPPRPCPRPG